MHKMILGVTLPFPHSFSSSSSFCFFYSFFQFYSIYYNSVSFCHVHLPPPPPCTTLYVPRCYSLPPALCFTSFLPSGFLSSFFTCFLFFHSASSSMPSFTPSQNHIFLIISFLISPFFSSFLSVPSLPFLSLPFRPLPSLPAGATSGRPGTILCWSVLNVLHQAP